MPAVYEQHGIQFAYPENWQLVEPQAEAALVDVTLQTPGGGFWSVQILPDGYSPAECMEQVLNGLRGEYEDLEQEAKTVEFGGVGYQGYEARFFCLDMLVEARIWACRRPGKTVICHYQAEQREFIKMEPVFQAITTSLFQQENGN